MRKFKSTCKRAGAASVLILLLPLFSLSCTHGSSTSNSGTFEVQSSQTATTFSTPTMEVRLNLAGQTMANPVIHYTMDLSTPTAASTVYTGPITISSTTVIKAIGINPDMSQTDVLVVGYVKLDGPYRSQWAASGHGDITGEAFRHWDDDGSVSTSCARCHGGGGLSDYLADGVVDSTGVLPLGHDCNICHQPVSITLYDWKANYPFIEPVAFPSMDTATLLGQSNLCLACHQGRESGDSIDDDILADPTGPYTFVNIHYYAAGATFFGTETGGGYEYPGKQYVGQNTFPSHDAAQQTCVGCHMRGDLLDHTLVPKVSDCTSCHSGSTFETLGGTPDSNYRAIHATHTELLAAVQSYAINTLGFPIAYDANRYPYFVHDTNSNGVADSNELGFGNRYDEFDATLLKAAYNYQVAAKDPAGYIHNGTYIRQLVNDSIEALGWVPSKPAPGRANFNLATATKSEQWLTSGHAASAAEAFTHWDGDGEVAQSCAKCHSSTGFIDFIEDGVTASAAPLGQLVECSACHGATNLFADDSTRYADVVAHTALEPVTFPSGATQSLGDASNICMTCHQGRSSGLSIDAASSNSAVQAPTDYSSFDFINRHYFAAAAIMFGSDATASYEYAGQTYEGLNTFDGHSGDLNSCLSCHMRSTADHSFNPQVGDCSECHFGVTDFEDLGLPFRAADVDYDGSGLGQSFDAEIKGMAANLYTAIQAYAVSGLPQSSPVIYVPTSYPYWFKDTDANGVLTPGENNFGNRYRDFDIHLLRAAYNYHSAQDPCGDIHNYKYVLQSLYDSTDFLDNSVLDGSIVGTRP